MAILATLPAHVSLLTFFPDTPITESGDFVSNTFKWLASRSILGGFATAAGLGAMYTALPPGSAHDALAGVARGPAVLLAQGFCAATGDPPAAARWGGIFDGFGILFYSLLWYVALSLIVQIKQIKGE
ncbi:MAG TPA: hypothetical protein VMD92_01655 [Acidobacteriaceae bacterium]|jgi:hypothetical protein|nr:hypothetical protein [Acidobacteriaceae bacterium]